jgi:hypothetical protein
MTRMRIPSTHRTHRLSALALFGVVALLAACAPQNPAISEVDPVEFPEPVAVEPGSVLALGDAAWVEQASAGKSYLLGVAVLDIVEGEPWIWKNFQNADELYGLTPYFVIVQRRWISADEKYDISLYPVLSDGTDGYLMETDAFGAINPATCDDLSLGLPHLTDAMERFDCLLTAAPQGLSVTGMVYDGTFAREAGNLDPTAYLDAPVIWTSE